MSDSPDAAERVLRSLQDEGSGSSRAPLLNAKIERTLSPPLRPSSPDQTCAICLGEITDKSVTDSCFHRFCFTCLSEWSKVKPECPLCKARFTAIYHGIKSMNDFQVYRLDHSRSLSQPLDSLDAAAAAAAALDPHIFINVAVQRAFTGRFGYRTTMGLNRTRGPSGHFIWGPPGSHEVMGPVPVSLPHPPSSGPLRVNIPSYPSQTSGAASSSSSRRAAARHQGIEFRKNVYRQNLWARPIDQNRIRESSPDFYRRNPAQTHRLVPWLARELNALSDLVTGFRFEVACRDILQWIKTYPISSADFKRNLVPYLGAKSDHFIHEFYQFAISPYDMLGYDLQTRYTPSTAEQAVTQNGSDDDMEIDHELPMLPFNLSVHDPIAPLRACIGPIGRPTRNISGRPRGLSNLSTFDLRSYLFPSPVHSSVQLEPTAPAEVIVLSSSEENEPNESADSDSEVEIIGSLPPLHLRPPEHVIDLDDSNDSDVIEIKVPSPPLIEIDDDNDDFSPQSPPTPSTSNGVAGPSGMQRAEGHLTRSSARFFRPSYREYSSSSEDEVQAVKKKEPKQKSSKKKASGSKKTRSSKRPKSSEFVESSDDSGDSVQDNKEAKDRRASRKELLKERKRRKSRDHSASHSSRREQDSEESGVSKRNSSLPSKILASKNSRKSKIDDCNRCKKRRTRNDADPVLAVVSSPERTRTKQQKRKRRKNSTSVSSSSDNDSSPPRRRKKDKGRRNSSSLSTTSKELDPSRSSSSSGFNDHPYVEGSNLARNPKAMSKKAMILQKRAAETSSPDGPPAYRYGEMVELRSPTYCSMVLDNQVDYAERAKDSFGTAEDSDSSSSTTLSMGTESAPPRHFEGLQSLHPSYSPLLSGPHSPSNSSFASSGRAVANGSPPRSNDLTLQPPSPTYSQAKVTLKSESIPSGPPSIASPSSDSSSTRSTMNSPLPLSNNSWPELSASQPAPDVQNQSETQPPSSPPNLHRFDDSPIITLEHSPLMSPPDESSSWNSSSESPSASPPRLKSIVTRISTPSIFPLVYPTSTDNTSSGEED